MNYDTYASNAVELAIDLANVDRDAGVWAAEFLRAHDEWFTDGSARDLTADEAGAAAETADLVRADELAVVNSLRGWRPAVLL